MDSPSTSPEPSKVVKAIKGVKLNVRKKSVLILVETNGELNDEWEEIDSIDDSHQHLLDPFQEAIDHLKQIDPKNLGKNDRAHPPGEENEEEYEVETILGVMHDGTQILFYIKWDGWDIKFNNWEPESNCSCEELAEPFSEAIEALKKQFDKPGPKSRKAKATARRSPKNVSYATPASSSEDEEPKVSRKPGPKSRTRAGKAKADSKSPARRPGPKSRTIDSYLIKSPNDSTNGKAGSPKKRPGPRSRTKVSDDGDTDDGSPTPTKQARRNSDLDSGSDSDKPVEEIKKRPGPASRTSVTPASSARKPGPRSRTMVTSSPSKKTSTIDDDDSSDY